MRDRSRPLGLAYECRQCHSARRKGRDRRPERWANMTPEQRDKRLARQRRYSAGGKGRAITLRNAYRRIDACNLSADEVEAIIGQPCVYCGTTEDPRGLDRIDNGRPHVRGNVQPCCAACNVARGDRFTVHEMLRIGIVIAAIRRDRRRAATGNEVHRGNLPNPHPIRS